nr:MAG TPA: pepsin inhibitor [Caudoviricetes sp.]
MKKYINGSYIDMTAEEIAELEQLAAEQPAPEPTAEERIAVLEEALNMLLSGVTE